MTEVTREQLHAYLDDALSEAESARVEQALRDSDPLRQLLQHTLLERDRGEHSLGAVWRRERLTCPTREQLGSYLLEAVEEDLQDYVTFHLEAVGCPYCLANLADLKSQQQEAAPKARERRQRFFQSSAGHLGTARNAAT